MTSENQFVDLFQNLLKDQKAKQAELKYKKFYEVTNIQKNDINLFSILSSIKNNEIVHSQFLSWLMNPKETHNLGDLFLKQFLSNVLGIDDQDFINIENEKTGTKSSKKIDILIELSNSIVCIENKIDSNEGKTQLSDYVDILRKDYPLKEHKFIYLTPTGQEPSNENYIKLSYYSIFSILVETLNTKPHEFFKLKTSDLIRDYTILIYQDIGDTKHKFNHDAYELYFKNKKLFEIFDEKFNITEFVKDSPKLIKIADTLYEEFEHIFLILNEIGKSNVEKKIVEKLTIEHLEKENFCITYCNDSYVRFITKTMKEYFLNPSLRNGWKNGRWLFSFEFFFSYAKDRVEFQAVIPSTTKELKQYRSNLEQIIKEIEGYDKHPFWENPNWPHYHKNTDLNLPLVKYDDSKEIYNLISLVKPIVDTYDNKFENYKNELLSFKEKVK
tara:strand:+ start:59 stop:1387 length:1329 start_codon:yes stop_codon:yes gene_type:complete